MKFRGGRKNKKQARKNIFNQKSKSIKQHFYLNTTPRDSFDMISSIRSQSMIKKGNDTFKIQYAYDQ